MLSEAVKAPQTDSIFSFEKNKKIVISNALTVVFITILFGGDPAEQNYRVSLPNFLQYE